MTNEMILPCDQHSVNDPLENKFKSIIETSTFHKNMLKKHYLVLEITSEGTVLNIQYNLFDCFLRQKKRMHQYKAAQSHKRDSVLC